MERPFTADKASNNPRGMQQNNYDSNNTNQQYDSNNNNGGGPNDMYFQQYDHNQGFSQRSGSAKSLKPGGIRQNYGIQDSNKLPPNNNTNKGFRAQTALPQNRPGQGANPYQGGKRFQAPLQQKADFFKRNQETFDKEQLFEDLQHAKGMINQLKEENAHLKTRNLNMERENNKQQKLIEELQHISQGKKTQKFANDTFLITSLKRTTKELQQEVQFKTQEIEKLKKNIKYTKFSEIEIEKKAFADETIRLRKISEQLLEENRQQENHEDQIQQLEERCFLLNNLVETLRKDNTDMANAIRILEEKAYNDQQQSQQKQKQLQDVKKQLTQQKKQNAEKDEQLKSLRLNHAQSGSPNKKQPQGNNYGNQKNSNNNKQQENNKNTQQQLQSPNKSYNQQQQQQKPQQQQEQQDVQQQQQQQQETDNQQQQKQQENSPPPPPKKKIEPRVQAKDVAYYIDYVKILIQLAEFDIQSDLKQHLELNLPKEVIQQNKITQPQLKEYFIKSPYQLSDTADLDLLIRFITEPESEEEYIEVDPEKQFNLSIVKGKISSILPVKIQDAEQKNQHFEYISYIFKSKMENIRHGLADVANNKDSFEYTHLSQAFEQIPIKMTSDQIDYILTKIINFNDQKHDSNCLKNLKITDLFAAFSLSMERPNRAKRPVSSRGRRTSEQGQKQQVHQQQQNSVSPNQNKQIKDENNNNKQVQFKDNKSKDINNEIDEYGEDEDFENEQTKKKKQEEKEARDRQIKKEEEDLGIDDDYGEDFDEPSYPTKQQSKQIDDDEYGDDFEDNNNNENKKNKNNKNNNKKKQETDEDYGDDFEDDNKKDTKKKKKVQQKRHIQQKDQANDKLLAEDVEDIPHQQHHGKEDLSRDLVDDKLDLSDGDEEY